MSYQLEVTLLALLVVVLATAAALLQVGVLPTLLIVLRSPYLLSCCVCQRPSRCPHLGAIKFVVGVLRAVVLVRVP